MTPLQSNPRQQIPGSLHRPSVPFRLRQRVPRHHDVPAGESPRAFRIVDALDVLPPGSTGEAVFIGSSEGNSFRGPITANGNTSVVDFASSTSSSAATTRARSFGSPGGQR